jgi:thiaminase
MKKLSDELSHNLKHPERFFNICVDEMGINAEDLRNERLSQALSGYTAWLELNAMTDDVFSNYVRMIPWIWVSGSHKSV